ncbi:60S ribosomal protein L31-like protein [Tanacetum coccineum]
MDDDLFTYEVEVANILCDSNKDDDSEQRVSHEADDDIGYDPSDVAFTECWKNVGYCNGGNLPGAYIFGNLLHYQDYEWYEALKDSELKEQALRNKAIMEGLISDDESSNDGWRRCESHEITYHDHNEIPLSLSFVSIFCTFIIHVMIIKPGSKFNTIVHEYVTEPSRVFTPKRRMEKKSDFKCVEAEEKSNLKTLLTFKKKAPKAIKEIKKFAQNAMGTTDVRVDVKLNKHVWSRGIRSVPRRVRVRIARKRNDDEDAKEELYSLVTVAEIPAEGLKGLGTKVIDDED